jgi:ribosome-binding factor A
MASIRQEKMARVIKEAVYDAITHHLNDPRIEGFVSITQVLLSPDLRLADVYLSVFGKDEKINLRTYNAIVHAAPRIQSLLLKNWHARYCPTLRFHQDEAFKKTLEVMKIIDEAAQNIHDENEDEENNS